MPLFVKDGVSVLYIHAPKTGGSSIEHFFLDNGFHCAYRDDGTGVSFNPFRLCSPQHMHADQLRSVLQLSRITYIFMTVRHPMTRLLSEFRMRVRDDGKPHHLPAWVDRILRGYISDPFTHDNHIRPQADFLIPGCDVFRLERGFGPGFVAQLEERTGLAFTHRQVGHEHPGHELAIPDADIDKIRPAVRQFYRQDFLAFGYKAGSAE